MTDGKKTATSRLPQTVQEYVIWYIRNGEAVVPIDPNYGKGNSRGKAPKDRKWQEKDYTAQDFKDGWNVGLRGDEHRGMLDCDFSLDEPVNDRFARSVRIMEFLNIDAKLSKGRRGYTAHFRSSSTIKSADYTNLKLQLIARGKQSIVPPSVAQNVKRTWAGTTSPLQWELPTIDGQKMQAVLALADALFPSWSQDEKRHNTALGFRGFCRKNKIDAAIGRDTIEFLGAYTGRAVGDHLRVFDQDQGGKEYPTLNPEVFRNLKHVLKRGVVFGAPAPSAVQNQESTEPKSLTFSSIQGNDVGKEVRMSLWVSGESNEHAIHLKFDCKCIDCGAAEEVILAEHDMFLLLCNMMKDIDLAKGRLPKLQFKRADDGDAEPHKHRWRVTPVGDPLIYLRARVRDDPDILMSNESSVKDYDAFIFSHIPNDKKIIADGILFPHPKWHEIHLLGRSVKPVAQAISAFEFSDSARDFLTGKKHPQTMKECLHYATQLNPKIAGHEMAKLAALLTYLSVQNFSFSGKPFLGTLRALFFGDPRQAKGEVGNYLRQRLGIGKHVIGETSSRTGIAYTIDNDRRIILWGCLVEADKTAVIIEGLHGFPEDDIAALREVLAQGRIEVRRNVSGAANARTRIIGDSNCAHGYSMDSYAYPVLALRQLPFWKDLVDLTRWDLFIPFTRGEVTPADIYDANVNGTDDANFLKEVDLKIRFAFSRTSDEVVFLPETIKAAGEAFIEMLKKFRSDIPVVHEDSLRTILRLSVAFAVLRFSVDESCTRVVVTPVDIGLAVEFLHRQFEMLWLSDYIAAKAGTNELAEGDVPSLIESFENSPLSRCIFDSLALSSPQTSRRLAEALGHNDSAVRRVIEERLLPGKFVNITSAGYIPTPKGLKAWRRANEMLAKRVGSSDAKPKAADCTDSGPGNAKVVTSVMSDPPFSAKIEEKSVISPLFTDNGPHAQAPQKAMIASDISADANSGTNIDGEDPRLQFVIQYIREHGNVRERDKGKVATAVAERFKIDIDAVKTLMGLWTAREFLAEDPEAPWALLPGTLPVDKSSTGEDPVASASLTDRVLDWIYKYLSNARGSELEQSEGHLLMGVSEEIQNVSLYTVKDACKKGEGEGLLRQRNGRWSAVISDGGESQ